MWKILDEHQKLLLRTHEQRVFLLVKYRKVCKKFNDIIQQIMKKQKLQMVLIQKRRSDTTAIEINNNRLIITNEDLQKYIEREIYLEKLLIYEENIWKENFYPQEYQEWKSEKEKRYKKNKNFVDEKQSSL